MDHQVIGNQPNRRGFLKRSVLGAGALAGLPSLGHPLFAAASDKARLTSKKEPMEPITVAST